VASYLNRFLVALADLEEDVVRVAYPGVVSVPYFFYHQETFPYITHRISEIAPDPLSPVDVRGRSYNCIIRVVVGHVGASWKNESEYMLYEILPMLEDFIDSNGWLQDAAGLFPVPELSALAVQPQQGRGLVVFNNAGIESMQVGAELITTVEFSLDRED
jgi:hypothetical protein